MAAKARHCQELTKAEELRESSVMHIVRQECICICRFEASTNKETLIFIMMFYIYPDGSC